MQDQEYPARHFDQMARLVKALGGLAAQMLEHGYSYESFGSWWSIFRFKGIPFRVGFDGRDREVGIERSKGLKAPYEWSEISRRTLDTGAADALERHLVDALKGTASAG
jgi:hypothetical protein